MVYSALYQEIFIDGIIYTNCFETDKYCIIRLDKKLGLVDKKTGKVLLKPVLDSYLNMHYIDDYEVLVKIYQIKLNKEKLKQLKEDLKV